MQVRKFDLFPTQVLQVKNDIFTSQDIEDAKQDINYIIDQRENLQLDDITPRWQSYTILFREDIKWWSGDKRKDVWKKLQKTFVDACKLYLDTCDCYAKFRNVDYAASNAWFFKADDDVKKNESNPVHDHEPAFLSGVFYLSNPGDPKQNGTTFFSPGLSGYPAGVSAPGDELTWVIFPGGLKHESNYRLSPVNTDRYVIAANMYAKVV